MAYEFKAPKRIKIFFGILVLGLLVYNIPYKMLQWKKNKKLFFATGFSSTVVDSSLIEGRFLDFKLENGLHVYLYKSSGGVIRLGDRIQKKQNTYNYNVYRLNANETYELGSIQEFMYP